MLNRTMVPIVYINRNWNWNQGVGIGIGPCEKVITHLGKV